MLGHVTRDEIAGGVRLGGAASYAAQAAACLGYETALVTVAPPDDPLLEPLRRAPRLSLHCLPSEVMTTFALAYAAGKRQLWLRRRARPLVLDDVPPEWRRPRVAYVGPVAGECDTSFAQGLGASFLGAGIQGWLRRTGEDGRVEPALLPVTPEAERPLPFDVAIVSEEDHPDAEGAARRMARTVALTRGARGARLFAEAECLEIPAAPAREVDATGAGDVFGVVLTLELAQESRSPSRAGQRPPPPHAWSRGRGWGRSRVPIAESAAVTSHLVRTATISSAPTAWRTSRSRLRSRCSCRSEPQIATTIPAMPPATIPMKSWPSGITRCPSGVMGGQAWSASDVQR